MSATTASLACCIALFLLAIWCRGRDPVLAPYEPAQDTTLGTPHVGVHKLHWGGVAVVDFVGALLLAASLARVSRGPFTFWLVVVLVASEVLHVAFGVRTALFRWLFVPRG